MVLLWYGYIYYLIAILLALTLFVLLIKSAFTNLRFFQIQWNNSSIIVTSLLNTIALLTLVALYNIFEIFVSPKLTFLTHSQTSAFFHHTSTSNLLPNDFLDLQYFSVYYFPFIYIFIVVTFLSLFFCLTYNKNEFNSFIFFCFIILLAGYVLFCTDSLVHFFL
jgi:hypothetical protein